MPQDYVADTHALAYYLADKLPPKLNEIFKDAEEGDIRIYVPSIAVAELIYLFEKTQARNKIWELFEKLDIIQNLVVYPLDVKVLRRLPEIRLPDIHDRIIVATCIVLDVEMALTKDEKIKASRLVKTVW